MQESLISEIVGTMMELSVFFIVFYILMEIKKTKLPKYILLYGSMVALVVLCNHFIEGYGAFLYIFSVIFTMKLFTGENFFRVLILFVMIMIIMLFIELILMATIGLLLQNDLIKSVVILLIANMMVGIIVTRYKEGLKGWVTKYEGNYINFMAINIFIYAFVFKIIWDFNEAIITNNYLLFGVVMFLLLVVNYFVYREVAAISEKSKALELQEGMRETLDLMVADIKSRQHEYKNTLTTIQGFIDTNDSPDAVSQIRLFLDDIYEVDTADTELLSIDRNIVKAVLFMKSNEARERGIQFDFQMNASLKDAHILDFELSTVISNLLNNAFEAVEKIKQRHVSFEVGFDTDEKTYYVQTKNAGSHIDPALVSKLPEKNFSTKDDKKKNHGFGLYNIKSIAKKNKGNLEIFFEHEDIVFRATFV